MGNITMIKRLLAASALVAGVGFMLPAAGEVSAWGNGNLCLDGVIHEFDDEASYYEFWAANPSATENATEKTCKPVTTEPPKKEWYCHATGSETNPYSIVHVSVNSDHKNHSGDKGPYESKPSTEECPEEVAPPTTQPEETAPPTTATATTRPECVDCTPNTNVTVPSSTTPTDSSVPTESTTPTASTTPGTTQPTEDTTDTTLVEVIIVDEQPPSLSENPPVEVKVLTCADFGTNYDLADQWRTWYLGIGRADLAEGVTGCRPTTQGGALPATGSNAMWTGLIGTGLIAGGATCLILIRRRRPVTVA